MAAQKLKIKFNKCQKKVIDEKNYLIVKYSGKVPAALLREVKAAINLAIENVLASDE